MCFTNYIKAKDAMIRKPLALLSRGSGRGIGNTCKILSKCYAYYARVRENLSKERENYFCFYLKLYREGDI